MGFYYGMQSAFFDIADRDPDLPLVRFISLAENGTNKQDVLNAFDRFTYFCVAGDVRAPQSPLHTSLTILPIMTMHISNSWDMNCPSRCWTETRRRSCLRRRTARARCAARSARAS